MERTISNGWYTTAMTIISSYLIMIYGETNACKVLALFYAHDVSIFIKLWRKMWAKWKNVRCGPHKKKGS